MKKIYSFVLMAAMLLVGANAWADTQYATNLAQVNAYFADATTTEVVLQSGSDEVSFGGQIVLNNDKHVILNLNEKTLTINNTASKGNVGILVKHGRLEIKNGTIVNGSNGATTYTVDLIRVIGTTETGIDAESQTPYSQVIIDADATISSILTQDGLKFNALTITENATKVNNKSYSNGARIDVYGTVNAATYGIKVNGSIQKPEPTTNSPYVYVHSGSTITTTSNANNAVAAYAAGYARWMIEGTCSGSTGVYVKSGDVDINGATISSNFTLAYDSVDNVSSKSGVTGAGSAVAVESNQNYSGSIDVTISGGSTLTAGTGYALEENVSNNLGTVSASDIKVEAVTVQDASFKESSSVESKGAISISATTTTAAVAAAQDEDVQEIIIVTSAKIEGDIKFGGVQTTTPGSTDEHPVTLNDLVTSSAYFPAEQPGDPAIVVPLDVTLTNDGFASFSAPIDLYKKTNNFTIHTGTVSGEKLVLSEGLNYIKAGEGVILHGTGSVKCEFTTYEPNEFTKDTYSANDLKPSTAWAQQTNKNQIYCLRNVSGETMYYLYTGLEMAANKAYLDLGSVAGAPQRIRMVIAQEEQTEAVERVEAASVKAVKFVENGEILIRRGENVYNLQGQIVK